MPKPYNPTNTVQNSSIWAKIGLEDWVQILFVDHWEIKGNHATFEEIAWLPPLTL